MTSVVFRTEDGDDEEVGGDDSDEDTLDGGVVGNVLDGTVG